MQEVIQVCSIQVFLMLHLGLIGSLEFAGEPQAVFAFLDTGVRRQEL